MLLGFPCFLLACVCNLSLGESPSKTENSSKETTKTLVQRIGASIVTIRVTDRDGEQLGIGTGFVIDASGLIATNCHVIHEHRPMTVELSKSRRLKVLAIEASNREDDLAIIRVAPNEHDLVPLNLSDEATIAQGVSVLAFGNPLGLEHSVTQGVVSAKRIIEGREMIQIAIPIEFGNSGGPIVDLEGTVHGIISLKSAREERIGFAIPISKLKSLMQATNPITIDRWVRMGNLDANRWKVIMGGQWQERSGVMSVTGQSKGFGGRVLCLSQLNVPEETFEVAVDVKLDDESGAAGLAFNANGGDLHYGFYPTNRKMRLTCFNGPNVLDWEIIQDEASKHYVPKEWNRLRVRIEGSRIQCSVNGHLVFDVKHSAFTKGQAGLAAFRSTAAEFRRFRIGASLEEDQLRSATQNSINSLILKSGKIEALDESDVAALAFQPEAASREMNRQADELGRRIEGLNRLADDVRLVPILDQLNQWRDLEDESDLLVGGLLVAAIAHPDIDIQSYVRRVDQMAEDIQKSLPKEADEQQNIAALNRYLFEENGFHGGQNEYYHLANNQLDRVIDDREGMPITLCLLYMEIGKRLGLKIEGVGIPGHFVVRYCPVKDKPQLIDVFRKAETLTETEVAMMMMMRLQRLTSEEDLRTQQPIEILTRILVNLLNSAKDIGDLESMRRYTEGLVTLVPNDSGFRLMRGQLRYQTGRLGMASQDLDWIIEHPSEGLDMDNITKFRAQVDKDMAEKSR